MNKLKTIVLTSLVLGLTAFGPTALAQDVGFYAGASFGQSKIEGETDTGWKIFGGYQINKSFGAEFGYVNLGKVKESGALPIFGAFTATIDAKAWQLVGVGTLPIDDRFSVFGKLGFARWDADLKCTGFLAGCGDDSGTDLTFGVGVKYNLTRNLAVRGEWENFDLGDADADLLLITIVYKF